mgnify:CR=1 FL=1
MSNRRRKETPRHRGPRTGRAGRASSRLAGFRVVPVVCERDGIRILVTATVPPPGAPLDIVEGCTRRLEIVTTGRCACGASWSPITPIVPGSVDVASAEHEFGCTASDEYLLPRIKRWIRGAE